MTCPRLNTPCEDEGICLEKYLSPDAHALFTDQPEAKFKCHMQLKRKSLCDRVYVGPGECCFLDRALDAYNRLIAAVTEALPCDPAMEFSGEDCAELKCKWHDVCALIREGEMGPEGVHA